MKTRDDFDKLIEGERGLRRAITLVTDPDDRKQMIGTLGLIIKLQQDRDFDEYRSMRAPLPPREQREWRYGGR